MNRSGIHFMKILKVLKKKARKYIYRCKNADGGISYSSRNRGTSRPAITAAALATLYNAGDYDSQHVPDMLPLARKTFIPSRSKIGPSDTGLILTCTTPKSFIVKEPVSGRFFGINCITGLLVNNKTMDPGWVTSAPSM